MTQTSSPARQRAEQIAREFNQKLTAYDFDSTKIVYIRTDEGFAATIPSAFAVRWIDHTEDLEWYMVFAEHHDPLVFSSNDVDCFRQYTISAYRPAKLEKYEFKEAPK